MSNKFDLSILRDGSKNFGLSLSEHQLEQFDRYLELLLDWNQRFNLTTINDPREIQVRHFLDSLSCSIVTGDLSGLRLIDVGSGAGFPGLPIKILYPRMHLTLVESIHKKANFLKMVMAELALGELEIIVDRAESLGQHPEYRGQYDWAVARSVALMPTLVEFLLPFCKKGGRALALKSEGAAGEINLALTAINSLGGGTVRYLPVQLPGIEKPHYLVVIEKVSDTPAKYPRRVGVPSKRPL